MFSINLLSVNKWGEKYSLSTCSNCMRRVNAKSNKSANAVIFTRETERVAGPRIVCHEWYEESFSKRTSKEKYPVNLMYKACIIDKRYIRMSKDRQRRYIRLREIYLNMVSSSYLIAIFNLLTIERSLSRSIALFLEWADVYPRKREKRMSESSKCHTLWSNIIPTCLRLRRLKLLSVE